MTSADWADDGAKSVAMVLSGSADPDIGDDGALLLDDDLVVLVNAWWEPLTFAVELGRCGSEFEVESDSDEPARRGRLIGDGKVEVGPRSVAAWLRKA